MVTKRDDDDRRRRQGEYRAICLWKMDWQSFAKHTLKIFWILNYVVAFVGSVIVL